MIMTGLALSLYLSLTRSGSQALTKLCSCLQLTLYLPRRTETLPGDVELKGMR